MFSAKKALQIECLENYKNYKYIRFTRELIFGSPSFKIVFRYRVSCYLREKKLFRLSRIMLNRIATKYGCYIGSKTFINYGLKLPHPTGIVIGETVKIGKNCTIFQQVTIGGAKIGDAKENMYPEIGDNVVIFSGAKLLGNISIGNNVIIGANSVVIKSVPDNCTIAGIPAKIIKNKSNKK
jgi:serine O-acetyltransferase